MRKILNRRRLFLPVLAFVVAILISLSLITGQVNPLLIVRDLGYLTRPIWDTPVTGPETILPHFYADTVPVVADLIETSSLGPPPPPRQVNEKQLLSTTVLIIGAGISGAGAVEQLTKHGITDFLVLEAQDVIGGRMKPAKLSGVNVELGANWVEGVGGHQINPIWTMAQKLNLTTHLTNYEDYVQLLEDGTEDKSNTTSIFSLKMEEAEVLIKERNSLGLEDLSVKTALELVGWNPLTALEDCVQYMGVEEEFAGNVALLSAIYTLSYGTEEQFGSEIRFVSDQRSYKIVPETIFMEAKAVGKIRFGEVVEEIQYGEEGVTVITSKGRSYRAQYLISTVSLGVYQHNRITFQPPLRFWKIEALFKFQMEIYTKIFLDFPTHFWSNREFTYFASNEKGYFPCFMNLMAPGYMKDYAKPGHNFLLATVTGIHSDRIERMKDKEIIQELVEILQRMFPKKRVPIPQAYLVPRWGKDPLFYGSFTNWPIGMREESWANLVAPLDRRVFFGGEMASRDYYGYVHGGYLAGVKTGDDVAACLQGNCNPIHYYPNGIHTVKETVTVV